MSKKAKLKDLVPDDRNYNKGNEFGNALIEKSLSKFGAGRSILLDKNNRIIAGNKTVENAGSIGMDNVIIVETTGEDIVAVKRTDVDLDSETGREMALADNASAKANIEWDEETIKADWSNDEQKEWGVHVWETDEGSSVNGEEYSKKIEAPTYEPKNEKPEVQTLYNIEKTSELIDQIENSALEKEEKRFLILAAQRHCIFNYEKIADYYAHSSKEVQSLMENSALVIIDFNKAIENGFTKLTDEIISQYHTDYDGK